MPGKSKKNKKATVRVNVVAQKARPKKKRAKRNMKSRAMMPHGSGTRSLLNSSVPRTFYSVKGSQQEAHVKGCELIARLETSQYATQFSMPLNPTLAQLFPKLSAYASTWERFRFKNVSVRYHTAAPATRSGSIGIAVHSELVSPGNVPVDPVLFGTYAYSAVGTVANSMQSLNWSNKDPEYFFTGSGALASQDPLKVFQGSVMACVAESSSADSGLLAGYLSIEYEVSFRNSRPSPIIAGLWNGVNNNQDIKQIETVIGVSRPALVFVGDDQSDDADPLVNSGKWMTRTSTNATNGAYVSVQQVVDGIKAGYSWVSAALGYLGVGVSPEAAGWRKDKHIDPRDLKVQVPLDATLLYAYNASICDGHPGWIPMEGKDANEDEKTGGFRGMTKFAPASGSTGDITTYVRTFDGNNTTGTLVFSVTAAGIGTGAYTIAVPPTRVTLAGNSTILPTTFCPFSGDERWLTQDVLCVVAESNY